MSEPNLTHWPKHAPKHLAVLPLFHVTGMQNSMNSPLYFGATIVLCQTDERRARPSTRLSYCARKPAAK